MAESRFVYVTFIRTTPEKLWQALIDPEITKQYWCQTTMRCEWKPGAKWELLKPDGEVCDAGEVLVYEPYTKIVLKWRNEFRPELTVEGFSRMTYYLEPTADTVKLTVTHEIDLPESKLIQAVSNGWPAILASLKSLLETGTPLDVARCSPKKTA